MAGAGLPILVLAFPIPHQLSNGRSGTPVPLITIAIQAGSGHRVFDARPAETRDALAAIEATSRETLAGLRRMMTGLRRAELGLEPEQAPLGPAPRLGDLERLAALTLAAGVQVDVDWRGSREPLPADIDLSAFRIIQEAVTNVVRHAAGEAGTGAEAVRLVRDADPDVIVMDIRMPGMDGIEATQLITAGDTRARVLVLTTFDDDAYVYGALRAGG